MTHLRNIVGRLADLPSGSSEELEWTTRLVQWVAGPLGPEELNARVKELLTMENKEARSGLDRCTCGCKYWENDTCIDCMTKYDVKEHKHKED